MALTSSRRSFLKRAAVVAGAAVVASDLRADGRVPPLVDTHVHFYDPSRPQGVPWPGKADTLLYRTVRPSDYTAHALSRPATGVVVMEASSWLEDNQWLLDLAKTTPLIVGVVGNLMPGGADFPAHALRFAADPLFRGIRIPGGSIRAGLGQPRFVEDLARLADLNLTLDVNGPPDTLADIARLATLVPTLRIVIDHHANISMDGRAASADWARDMRDAGSHPHVYAKLSGLVEGAGNLVASKQAPSDWRFYRPYLDVTWQAFGPSRVVYGSNWPVSERFASLETVQAVVMDYVRSTAPSALDDVLATNASAAYRWVPRSA